MSNSDIGQQLNEAMTHEERIQVVSAALSNEYSHPHEYGDYFERYAKVAIAACDTTLKVTDEDVSIFIKDAFALVAGKDIEQVRFHVRRALEAVIKGRQKRVSPDDCTCWVCEGVRRYGK